MPWVVKLDKLDFIGKTSLAQLKQSGLRQKLVGFEMADSQRVPDEGCQILDGDGTPSGRVTSARFSPVLQKAIGLAWVPLNLAAIDSELRIQLDGQAVIARVVPTPFYDPSGTRMKS